MENNNITEIRIRPQKSYVITGKVKLIHTDGTEEIKEGTFELCRCGQSRDKPWCDGAHKTIEFE